MQRSLELDCMFGASYWICKVYMILLLLLLCMMHVACICLFDKMCVLVIVAGEQQRIGMARLFFHRPKFGVLDECTNATSVDVEEQLYQHAAELGITLVTITQRLALVKYHDAELRLLDGEGDWELRQIIK